MLYYSCFYLFPQVCLMKYNESNMISESRRSRPSVGTTITVTDALHRMPVRKRAVNPTQEHDVIKTRIEAVALVHPHVSITLR